MGDGDNASATGAPIVAEAISVSKRFGTTIALKDVDLVVRQGQSHALVGRNGAGKSTLVAVLTGIVSPDGGLVRFAGQPAPPASNREAWRKLVACVYQRSMIFPELTVAENLFVNRQSTRGAIAWGALHRRASDLMEEYGVRVDVKRRAAELDVETRQMVEVARALSMGVRFIILDEPTAQLDGAAVGRLFSRIHGLQASGATFLYISHHLHEIYEVCETVTVLRDAQRVASGRTADISRDQLVEAMTGEVRAARAARAHERAGAGGGPRLSVSNLALAGQFRGIALSVAAGEIVGIAGSGSSGATMLGRCLAGLEEPTDGIVEVDGTPLSLGDVRSALTAGIGCVPEDRHKEGLVPLLSVGENLTLPIADKLGPFGAIIPARQRAAARKAIAELDIKVSTVEQPVNSLSGGNQQKVVMGRALSNDPKVLVLIDPTAGVDVRSKEMLLSTVERGAREGRAVVLVTDDVEDLRICDRILVMFRGEIVDELGPGWPESRLISSIEGVSKPIALMTIGDGSSSQWAH